MKRFSLWFFAFSIIGALIFVTACDTRPPIVVDLNPIDSVDHRDSTGSGDGSDSTICFQRDILPIFLSNCAMRATKLSLLKALFRTNQTGVKSTKFSSVKAAV